MPEWSNGPHSKCGERVTVPGVRIPLFPLHLKQEISQPVSCFFYSHVLTLGKYNGSLVSLSPKIRAYYTSMDTENSECTQDIGNRNPKAKSEEMYKSKLPF